MTYLQAISYLKSFINYEKLNAWPYKTLRLKRFKDFLAAIANPQAELKCIHVAGSKGKGSTCAFISYILAQAGYKVGLYTSPHLSSFRERIRVLDHRSGGDFSGMIPKKELTQLVGKLKPAIDKFNRCSPDKQLSFFEVYTALAFVYFKEKKVDYLVLETGLGGRLDATNVIEPLVCVITPISYEHTQLLGNTLRKIAKEKAGIIKAKSEKRKAKNLVVISAPQKKEALEVIRKKCRDTGSRLYIVGRDIKYKATKNGLAVKGIKAEYLGLKVRLLGEHQSANAAAAIAAVEALGICGKKHLSSIKQGLYNTVWPGRCEVIARNPLIVLDGAQNVASAAVIKKAVRDNFKYKKLVLVLGISQDKDIKGICSELGNFSDKVILTQADTLRAASSKKLAAYFPGKEIYLTTEVEQAKAKALGLAGKQDLILVTGSLFVVGEFRDERKH